MPRYSITVTVRLDAFNEDHAMQCARAILDPQKERDDIVDYDIEDLDNEDEMHGGED